MKRNTWQNGHGRKHHVPPFKTKRCRRSFSVVLSTTQWMFEVRSFHQDVFPEDHECGLCWLPHRGWESPALILWTMSGSALQRKQRITVWLSPVLCSVMSSWINDMNLDMKAKVIPTGSPVTCTKFRKLPLYLTSLITLIAFITLTLVKPEWQPALGLWYAICSDCLQSNISWLESSLRCLSCKRWKVEIFPKTKFPLDIGRRWL